MTKLYTLLIVAGFIFLYSCKSASKAYQKGDYTQAIELGVKKLQKDPNDLETRDLVRKSYSYEVNQHEDEIRILSNSKNDTRFERIFNEYSHLQNLYHTIHQYPAVARMIATTDYSEYLETYRDKASDVHSEKADKWMNEGTKDAFREAYREYQRALSFRPDDFELRRKRDQAYDAAVIKVLISPIQDLGGYRYSSNYQVQNFQSDVIRTLSYGLNNEFVKFYTEFEARSKDILPDQIMELNLSRVAIGQPFDNNTTREISKQVVVKEVINAKDSSVNKEYATVTAKITTTKRRLLSQGDLIITVRDPRGRILWNDRFTGEHKWETQFTSYIGDERALSDEDKKQLSQKTTRPPSSDEIMDELLRQIQNDLTYRLRGYFTSRQSPGYTPGP
jgi:tetratricopeptide (TPR) repeat protein